MKKAFEVRIDNEQGSLFSNLKKAHAAYENLSAGRLTPKTYSAIAAALEKHGFYLDCVPGWCIKIEKREVF